MIKSMTAFSRSEGQLSLGHLIWEVRSVNHRYLELHFRLPEELRYLEPKLRDTIKAKIFRGKLEITGKLNTDNSAQQPAIINEALVSQLISAAETIRRLTKHSNQINPTDILNWPNVLITPTCKIDHQIEAHIHTTFATTIEKLLSGRIKEGTALTAMVAEKNHQIQQHLNTIKTHLPQAAQQQREKLISKLDEIKVDIDHNRLEQELLYLLQKSDITEELERLETHTQSLTDILQLDEPVGRRLDFLLQEINREINTLGSKIPDPVITPCIVSSKVLIEQIREQVQNIE